MTVKPRHDFKPCVPGAFHGGLARTEFFDGMVLSEADMKREQGYWQMKRRLTNRALGSGVVWGLSVEWDAKARSFTVCPGYGLSCCGDDLVVECPETVPECDLIDTCSEDFRKLLAKRDDPCNCDKPDSPVVACLFLEYVECPEEPRQVFEDPCAERPMGCRYGAVRETVRLRLIPPPPPPPKGPIERFSEKIEVIRKALADAGVALPDPVLTPQMPHAVTSIAGFAADDSALGGVLGRAGTEAADSADLLRPGDAATKFRLGLEPAAGWIFTRVAKDGIEAPVADTLMGVFIIHPGTALDAKVGATVEIDMVPLLGAAEARRVTYSLSAQRDQTGVTLSAKVASVEPIARRQNCATLLAEGLGGRGDTASKLRTLAMALLSGWFRGLLGSAPCDDPKDVKVGPVEEALAWMITWLAWRIIWGIDITEKGAAGVEKCLKLLFDEWCCGFHYKGPRCDCDAHGIFLGCVEISPKGKILCFDEWAHRRYVLTGPLLTHWSGQFGLAPLDVTATRLASWICCVSRAPMPSKPDFDLAAGHQAFLPMGRGGIGLGKGFDKASSIEGVPFSGFSRTVGPLNFVARALEMLMRGDDLKLSTASSIQRVAVDGQGLTLFEPIRGIGPFGHRDALMDAFITREVSAAPAMAKAPISDFVHALSAETSLADLQPAAENALVEPLVKALDSVGISTVKDLAETGPERALKQALVALAGNTGFADRAAAEKPMALLYGAALGVVTTAAAAIADVATGREAADPFIRSDLTEPGTLAAVRKAASVHLRGKGFTAAAWREIAGRVVDAQP